MSPTQRDGTRLKGPQADTRDTAESDDPDVRTQSPTEDASMNDEPRTLGIAATLARMALVRQHALSVNGAYLHTPSPPGDA